MARLTEADRALIVIALNDAIGWQRGLSDAYRHMKDTPEYADAVGMQKRYRKLLKRLTGQTKTFAERNIAMALKGLTLYRVTRAGLVPIDDAPADSAPDA